VTEEQKAAMKVKALELASMALSPESVPCSADEVVERAEAYAAFLIAAFPEPA
jgi:hypothetical protein